MINFPFISLPEHFTRLLVGNIQNTTHTNNQLEIYLTENKELNSLIKSLFRDIDPDGFIGKIISISGWSGIRNRLSAAYLEYAAVGQFPEMANLSLINDLVTIENKLRHFTPLGYSRSFLLAFYARMTLVQYKKQNQNKIFSPLMIKDEHIEFMKWSKAKSTRVDWLMLELILFDHYLGTERLNTLLQSGSRFQSLFALLTPEEQKEMMENFLVYGASINDSEIFLTDVNLSS